MSDQITYDDKADLIVDTTIDDMFKVSASDMNEIKNVVNSHADDIDVANNNITQLHNNKLDIADVLNQASTDTDKPYSADYLNDKLVSVGTTAPTDGTRVWFAKSKNLFDGQLEVGGYDTTTGNKDVAENRVRCVNYIKVNPNTTYTFSFENNGSVYCLEYNSNKTYLNKSTLVIYHVTTGSFTTSVNTEYITFYYIPYNHSVSTSEKCQLEQGSTATAYEQYVNPSINVDGEEWYNPSFAIKTKVYPSVTTTSLGYYNLNIKCDEVAIIGFTHDPIASATSLQLYSNEQGLWYIRCSVGDAYGERTITNLKIYYI